ncbi:hypothetical protein NC661_19355 [Aquibacillus koreensis]|uniref:Uncharacterized protein n=1 Tax=Aquibacillus koreensis TaxID=279446 RepID=A0A9X4AK58_9BACI|nr:CBO0543 family protein [Aquibacillus koreensis]MCT2535349.1 hypothetical protein [Aquibacillus koreensis]MDC3422514.1 hypothetical protein [Aquibacillus koreensis]
MNLEHMILYSVYACTFISFAFIPKNKIREASVIYLFQLFVSWFLGLLVVELDLIEYPIRELARVNGTSFLFEFLVYPIITVYYSIYYPRIASKWKGILYTGLFATGITIPEIIVERYTDIIRYLHWHWSISWLSIYLTLSLSWLFYKWYFKIDGG